MSPSTSSLGLCLLFALIILYYTIRHPFLLLKAGNVTIAGFILGVVIACLYIGNWLSTAFVVRASVGLAIIMILLYTDLSEKQMMILFSPKAWCIGGIVLTALSMIFHAFSPSSPSSSFFTQVIRFLPCLLTDLVSAIMERVAIPATPSNTMLALFLLEIGWIALYFGYPAWTLAQKEKYDAEMVHHEPRFLMEEKTIPITLTSCVSKVCLPYYNDFSISCWIHLNTFHGMSTDTPLGLLRYTTSQQQPLVEWTYHIQTSTTELRYLQGPGVTLSIPLQTWTHVVITIQNNVADVFINGVQQTSAHPKQTLQHSAEDKVMPKAFVTLGDRRCNTIGFSGAICNVAFLPSPMSTYEIVQEYNMLVNRNPPVW